MMFYHKKIMRFVSGFGFFLISMFGLLSCSGAEVMNNKIVMADKTLVIREEFLMEDSPIVKFFIENPEGLDTTHEILLQFPKDKLAALIPWYKKDRTEVTMILADISLEDKQKIHEPSFLLNTWYARNAFKERISIYDERSKFYKVYAAPGIKNSWQYLRRNPEIHVSEGANFEQDWVAICSSSSALDENGNKISSCKGQIIWEGILIEFRFSDLNSALYDDIKEAIIKTVSSWVVS